jgi:HEAT repeat protein
MKKNHIRRIALGVVAGMGLLAGVVWLLTRTGKPIEGWQEQLNGHDSRASNEAFTVANERIIPQLTDVMLHDTNDSRLRLSLIDTLNGLPGVQIYFRAAGIRRSEAAQSLGELGPAARSAVPALVQAVKGTDEMVHGAAIKALGKIHSDPDTLIPLLIGYLDDKDLNDEAALALANYGSLAKAAVPKIVPLLQAPDKDARKAATEALKKIDPAAYAAASKTVQEAATNGAAGGGEGAGPAKGK